MTSGITRPTDFALPIMPAARECERFRTIVGDYVKAAVATRRLVEDDRDQASSSASPRGM